MKRLHIAVHLGGGAGKAIAGTADAGDVLILLEQPEKTAWVCAAERKGVRILEQPEDFRDLMKEADIVIIHWWGHPLMVHFLADLPEFPCRLALYSHVNGCVYPYLPFSFLREFDAILFTTPYSYANPLWTESEKAAVERQSAVVYGMGEFKPERLTPRDSYAIRDCLEVGYIGTLNYVKLNPDFVKYCEAAAERTGNIRFVLAGELADDVRRDIDQSRIADKFEYVGYVENAEKFYRRIDALGYLLNGYNFATTENVLLEAMAYAVPVVALEQDVESHVLGNGRGGCLVNSAEEYAEAIAQLYFSEKRRKTLGNAGRKFCIEKYSGTRNREVYKSMLEKLSRIPKSRHHIACLEGKEPYEWLQFFAQKDRDTFCGNAGNVFLQESKGSAFQYSRYFPWDMNLKNVCISKKGGE